MAGAVYFISIPGVTGGPGAATATTAAATANGVEGRPQSQQVQSQASIAGVNAGGGTSSRAPAARTSTGSSSLPYPGDAVGAHAQPSLATGYADSPAHHSHSSLQQHLEPQFQDPQAPQGSNMMNSFSGPSQAGANTGVVGGSPSPSMSNSTPSWVLPKKGSPGSSATGHGSSVPVAGAGGSSSYYG